MPTKFEDRFIRTWRDNAATLTAEGRGMTSDHSLEVFEVIERSVRDHGLAERVTPHPPGDYLTLHKQPLKLTPRGLDLLATADAIGYDPDAKPEPVVAPPPTQTCGTCKGEGRVLIGTQQSLSLRGMKDIVEGLDGTDRDPDPLLREADAPEQAEVLPGWDVTCGECKGAKVVRIDRTQAKVSDFSRAWLTPLIWHDPASLPSGDLGAHRSLRQWLATVSAPAPASPGEWIDFTCLADVEGWEGATIEVRHRDGEHHRAQFVKEIKHCTNLAVVHCERRSYSSHAGWQFRKLTSVEKPQAIKHHVTAATGWTLAELQAYESKMIGQTMEARWLAELEAIAATDHPKIAYSPQSFLPSPERSQQAGRSRADILDAVNLGVANAKLKTLAAEFQLEVGDRVMTKCAHGNVIARVGCAIDVELDNGLMRRCLPHELVRVSE